MIAQEQILISPNQDKTKDLTKNIYENSLQPTAKSLVTKTDRPAKLTEGTSVLRDWEVTLWQTAMLTRGRGQNQLMGWADRLHFEMYSEWIQDWILFMWSCFSVRSLVNSRTGGGNSVGETEWNSEFWNILMAISSDLGWCHFGSNKKNDIIGNIQLSS